MREMTSTHEVALTNKQLGALAPSVMAKAPHSIVSDRYGFVPTIDVIDALKEHGWMPVDAAQRNVRDISKVDFTRHLVRFRRLEDDIIVNDSAVELILTNSHDRSSGFVLHAGIFRMACANGIVIADSTFQRVAVRHNKDAIDKVIEGSYEVLDTVPEIAGAVEDMMGKKLTKKTRVEFAKTAMGLLYKPDTEDLKMVNRSEVVSQIITPQRACDEGMDLWSTFNVIQEHVIRGGVRSSKINKEGIVRSNVTKGYTNIAKTIKINKALWEMATELKAA